MGVSIYIPEDTKILHNAYVDFVSRQIGKPVHIVQYDDSLPILAVKLYTDGQPYTIPEAADVNIKFTKPDGQFVYNPALGCDSSRNMAYFELTYQMTVFDGEANPVIEVVVGDLVSASSSIYIVIDRNPVQRRTIESTSEWKTITRAIQRSEEAISAAERADVSRLAAETTAANAEASEVNAKKSEDYAYEYKNTCFSYTKETEELAIYASSKATEAESFGFMAQSYSVGGTGRRSGENEDNAMYYSNQSKASADTSKEYLGKVEQAGNEAVQKLQDALDMDAPSFQMDLSTGHLMYGGGRFVFNVNGNGHLEWGLAV